MFYAHFVLAKKGPLARIWLAAHWDKKLTKTHVFETNIESSVEGILQPKVKMALRTSGHLLLGIVRIYSRKAKYLLADCNEAFIKIKLAFRPGVVDLPEDNREAAVATITLPEVFHDFDTAMPDLNIDIDAQVTLNQSRAEDITLKEDYGTLSLMVDDGFEDMTFNEPEAARDVTNIEEGFEHASLLLAEDQAKERPEETAQGTSNSTSVNKPNVSFDTPLKDDGFGGTLGQGLLEDGDTAGLFEPAGLFDDAPVGHVALENTTQNTEQTEAPVETAEKPVEPQEEESDDDMYDMAPGSIGAPSPPSSPETPVQPSNTDNVPEADVGNLVSENAPEEIDIPVPTPMAPPDTPADVLTPAPPEIPPPPPEIPATPAPPPLEQTTLIHNEDESFALAPLDTTIVHGSERTVKAKRKRKLIVDEVKNISGEEMKSQLSDTTDIVITLDLAPPTKRLMHWKETGGVEKLFALPGHPILSKTLSRAYQRHLTTRSVDNEEFGIEDDHINLDADMEQAREESETTVLNSRKRPRREVIHQDLSHLDTLHLDTSHPSYVSDPNMTHPSLDVPNFLQPQPMFPPPMPPHQQQMMNTVHQPPDHMIQQMLQTDVNQLAHLPEMMHPSMVDQGPPLHAITPSITNDQAPGVSEAFNQIVHPGMESISDNPLSNALPDHMQQSTIENQMPSHSPLMNQINQQSVQDQISQSAVDHTSSIENHLHSDPANDMIQQGHVEGSMLQPPVDEDATQPCTSEEYTRSLNENTNTLPSTVPNMLPNNDQNILPVVNGPSNEGSIQNCTLQNEVNQTVNKQSDSNLLFDSLKNGENFCQNTEQTHSQNNFTNDQPNDDGAHEKKNELPVSDDEDDYAAPASVGPALPEEQMADETYEQFEERILTKRTTHMLHIINNKLDRDNQVSFADVARNNKRKQVAQKFYTFLVLKKLQAVELKQDTSYGVLIITRGPKFDAVYNSN